MIPKYFSPYKAFIFLTICIFFTCSGCAKTYYGVMGKVGIPKREILVDRVEKARDSQQDAQEQFKSALEQFGAVVQLQETDLKKAYDKLDAEYEASNDAANEVSTRIKRIESVADALFEEWQQELDLYQSTELRRSSKRQLQTTRTRYADMLDTMHQAEKSMEPVLRIFRDNVLYMKHHLNAQAIGSLQSEFATLEGEIDILLERMNDAIASSNKFIADIK